MVTALFEPDRFGAQIRRFWPRSLRWQLQAWQAFLFTSMLVAFGVAVYELTEANRFRQLDTELQTRVGALRRIISEARRREAPPEPNHGAETTHRHRPPHRPPDEFRFPRRPDGPPPGPRPPRSGQLPEDFQITSEVAALFGPEAGFYFLIWSREGSLLQHSQDFPAGSPKPKSSERDSLPHLRTWADYRELIHCSGVGDCVVVGRSVAAELRNATTIAWLLPLAGGTVLFFGLVVGSWLITRAVRPVEQIEATASEISKGKLSARVAIDHPDSELGQLSSVLNATFARLEAAFERQQQFTSDAAHELRTPLAIMISEAQTSLARERKAEEYKQTLEDCLDTAQQMRKLTDTLLDLARLEADSVDAERTEFDLADLATHCIRQVQPMASNHAVTLRSDLSCAPVVNLVNRMILVLTNLLVNAISYNRPGGEVCVTTRSTATHAVLSVTDTGIGIGPTDLPRIFDRFYRADKARSRAGGHAGLGLSICKAIIDAEDGTIQVRSAIGEGTVFTICLPLAQASGPK